jgi:hypothetical protein
VTTQVDNAPGLDDRNDGVNGASRRVAVVCSLRSPMTTLISTDPLQPRLDGPPDDSTSAAAFTNRSDRTVAAATTPLSRRVLSP